MSKRNHVPQLPDTFWDLPAGWTWSIVRVIHCLPDDQTDGWRICLAHDRSTVIEVLHRDVEHAKAIALEAAGQLAPSSFKEWVR
jgi:hypothetical protein